jgi:LPS O-antigen subunit length determinant protein (WzzB/FepE family)
MPVEELLRRVWRRRWILALLAAALFGTGAAVVTLLPRAYVAEAVVAPSETTGIATSALLSQAPAIGSFFDQRPTGNFAIYLGALRSAEAAAMLAAETPLLATLTERRGAGYAGDLRRALDLRMEADVDDLRGWLERELSVTQTLGAVTWTIALSHPDRALALDALRRLHAFAETKVRADLAEMARRRVAALEARLAREPDLYIRQSLYELLAQQQRAGVVVAADEAVAARLVQAPVVEMRPSLPNRPLLLLLLLVASPMAALAIVAAGALLAAPPRPLPGPAE